FFSSRRRHTRLVSDWSSDVCSSDLVVDSNGTPYWQRNVSFRAEWNGGEVPLAATALDDVVGGYALAIKGQTPMVDLMASTQDGEIGRASCRERGKNSEGAG